MELNYTQLELMKFSDKTLKSGTIIFTEEYMRFLRIEKSKIAWNIATCIKYDNTICWIMWFSEKQIIWNPFWRWRICMLYHQNDPNILLDLPIELLKHFENNPDLYDQNCLEWDESTAKIVLSFLELHKHIQYYD